MSDTPRTDALFGEDEAPERNHPHPELIALCRDLERLARRLDHEKGELYTKLKPARRMREEAEQRAHDLKIEARGYFNALMRCQPDARRWQYWRKRGIDLSGESDLGVVYKADADDYTDKCLDGRLKPSAVSTTNSGEKT